MSDVHLYRVIHPDGQIENFKSAEDLTHAIVVFSPEQNRWAVYGSGDEETTDRWLPDAVAAYPRAQVLPVQQLR